MTDGTLIDIPAGHVGAVVTFLEMTERPRPRPMPDSPFRLQKWERPDPDKYRILFRRVGGRWLWFSRLAMSDATLCANICEVHAVVDARGIEVGMIELDFAQSDTCLIRFLGLVPELAGKGHGKWLFAQVMALAWRQGVERVTVNTCTLDHPAALSAYIRAGFRAVRRAFESFPDPRLIGLLPRDVAPQIPLVEPPAS
ncbi:MAG TPA: GNAT family N-acetyltransferase [Allosphingosinicella sp.]